MKVILCGYHWVGCKALELLLANGHEVFVYTHDSQYYTNDLAAYCAKRQVPCTTDKIEASNLPFVPDVVASIYYRYIISEAVIAACQGRIFNLHPSLLPEYRGCSSLTWAMIDGQAHTGYSYHYITPEVDKGRLILQKKLPLEAFDTQASLYFRVMFEAAKDFLEALSLVATGFVGEEQAAGRGRYFKRGAPNGGVIDPGWSYEQKERFVRAMIFPPLPLATYKGTPVGSMRDVLALDQGKV
jgi:UDP-4-amino-4-deoxy-L-arabinose formyltransferase/UDP-glucuronic acid dehydrogenase (UDP-4-keto-hexauronic acid decarboxylating)